MRYGLCVSCGQVQETLSSKPDFHQLSPHYVGEALCAGSLRAVDLSDLHETYESAHDAIREEQTVTIDDDLDTADLGDEDPVDPDDAEEEEEEYGDEEDEDIYDDY